MTINTKPTPRRLYAVITWRGNSAKTHNPALSGTFPVKSRSGQIRYVFSSKAKAKAAVRKVARVLRPGFNAGCTAFDGAPWVVVGEVLA